MLFSIYSFQLPWIILIQSSSITYLEFDLWLAKAAVPGLFEWLKGSYFPSPDGTPTLCAETTQNKKIRV